MSTRTEVTTQSCLYVALAAMLLVAGGCGGVDPDSGGPQSKGGEDSTAQPIPDDETGSIIPLPGRAVRIRAKHSGQCLDVEGASDQPGAPIIQYGCSGAPNQRFLLEDVGGGYYRITAQHSQQCLDVEGGSMRPGAPVIQYGWENGHNQQFRIVDAGNGYYRLIARHSRLCLDVEGASNRPGARIIPYRCTTGDNQLFWFQ